MLPHAPQFDVDVRSVSHPFIGSPSQSPHPSEQSKPHAPAVHVGVAFGGVGHWLGRLQPPPLPEVDTELDVALVLVEALDDVVLAELELDDVEPLALAEVEPADAVADSLLELVPALVVETVLLPTLDVEVVFPELVDTPLAVVLAVVVPPCPLALLVVGDVQPRHVPNDLPLGLQTWAPNPPAGQAHATWAPGMHPKLGAPPMAPAPLPTWPHPPEAIAALNRAREKERAPSGREVSTRLGKSRMNLHERPPRDGGHDPGAAHGDF